MNTGRNVFRMPIWLSSAVLAALSGCRTAQTPDQSHSVVKTTVQPATLTLQDAATADCGLAAYPASRSAQEILAGLPPGEQGQPSSQLLARIAVNKEGQLTHIRVLRLAHSNAPNWKPINEQALNSILRWHFVPTLYQGKAVGVCSDVSVVVDLF